MQFRDRRTLVIELLFPIFLIVAGLALATIQFFKDGVPRVMSPSIFPTPTPTSYNLNGLVPDATGDISSFMNLILSDTDIYENIENFNIDTTSNDF